MGENAVRLVGKGTQDFRAGMKSDGSNSLGSDKATGCWNNWKGNEKNSGRNKPRMNRENR